MQRQIKFRVWDGEKMRTGFMAEGITLNNIWNNGYDAGMSKLEDSEVYGTGSPEWAWMQYTGLKDKNGVEIYEGDIVKWRSHPKPTKVSEVKWSDKSASFQLHWYDNDLERERGVGSNRSLWALNSIEVIGNIYENPELLEGKD